MTESASTTQAGATAGRCALHAERAASGTCDRCGSYYCGECSKALAGKTLCATCLALPGVDYLAEARAKAWGKRDGWIWYLGVLGTLGALGRTLGALAMSDWLAAMAAAGATGLFVAYFLQKPWSRKALFVVIPLYGLGLMRAIEPQLANDAAARGAAMLALFIAAAHYSTRNRLAFKLEVSDDALVRYYAAYVSNPSARRAVAYGIASLLVAPLAPVAIVFGVLAWRRADPKAWPPRKGRGLVIAGMLCAAISIIGWTAFVRQLAG